MGSASATNQAGNSVWQYDIGTGGELTATVTVGEASDISVAVG